MSASAVLSFLLPVVMTPCAVSDSFGLAVPFRRILSVLIVTTSYILSTGLPFLIRYKMSSDRMNHSILAQELNKSQAGRGMTPG